MSRGGAGNPIEVLGNCHDQVVSIAVLDSTLQSSSTKPNAKITLLSLQELHVVFHLLRAQDRANQDQRPEHLPNTLHLLTAIDDPRMGIPG